MTKKEIKELAKELLVNMNKTPLEMDVAMDDRSLDVLSAKIVARLIQLKELTIFHDRLHLTQVDWDYIDMSEEEDLLGELAKLMTLMNLYTDKEEYEKCSLLKARIRDIKSKLKEHEDDET
tara:strand:+ start:549 stop:911 length:363 start_codon:yes stop_codon:yes gene_type:complete